MDKQTFYKIKRRLTRHRNLVRGSLLTLLLAIFFFSLYVSLPPVIGLVKTLMRGPTTAFSLARDPQDVLKKTMGRTNILLLGMGGANHQGSDLTDSIVVSSINLSTADTVILSIPRDIWIDSLKTKINAIYHYGEKKQEGGGLVLAKSAVEEVIGQPIHYVVAVDFDGFKNAIDLVGGIDVNVPQSFDDYKYPIPGMENAEPEELRYEHLHFDAGLQTMDGDRSLKYVRSRNAEGEQGTDFARSHRQQQVITAFKDKLISREVLLSPGKLKELALTFSGSIKTDLSEPEYLSLAKLFLKSRSQAPRSGILKTETEEEPGLLINPPPHLYQNQWVLVGKNETWEEVHEYVNQLFYNSF